MKLVRRVNMIYYYFKINGVFIMLKWLVIVDDIYINKYYKCFEK